ncbi:MAG: helix-hairpin-helix domain-containing protein [Synergistaceae bacterium]|nr:helix-hairpin-helix domain-containing protein [Synergistaceae bacterium]
MMGALLLTCATAFVWFARVQIRSVDRERISLANRSMVHVLTRTIVNNVMANTYIKYDSPLLEWYKPFSFLAEDIGIWVVQVVPLDDRIPLRHLFLPDGSTLRNELRNIWEDMWVKLGYRELNHLVLDFLDRDVRPRMGGGERETHINRAPLDMSELLILDEITPEILYGIPGKRGMADYCTLWSDGKINLNMAPAHVLEILPGMDGPLAEKIVDYRERQALTEMSDLGKIPGFPPKSRAALMNVAKFDSQYLMIRIEMLEKSGGGTSFSVVFDKTGGTVVRWEEI